MLIKTLASGSKGNSYTIGCNGSKIMIECGIPIKEIKKGCGFALSEMRACLLTHSHKDHSKAAQDVLSVGIDLYCSEGTAQACALTGHRVHIIRALKQFRVGAWIILPFDAKHDADEPLSFLIANGNEKLLFATDTLYVPYRFKGLTSVMLECNYSLDTLDENIMAGYVDQSRRSRLLESHMSLEQCKNTLLANDLSNVQEIHLLHLSSQNADAERFKQEIQRLVGLPVYIAGQPI